MYSSSSQSKLQNISVVLPPGPFKVVVEKVDDGIEKGMCAVAKADAASPLQAHDIIVSLNGFELKEVNGGVDEWYKLFEVFSKGERKLVVRRATRQPVASSRSLPRFREIASAKQRLATAERWNKSNMDAVKKTDGRLKAAQKEAEEAKVELRSSQKEVKDAKSALEDVNKFYEVIDVDGGNSEAVEKAEGRLKVWLKAYQKEAEEAKAKLGASEKEVSDVKSSWEDVSKLHEVIDVDAAGNGSESDSGDSNAAVTSDDGFESDGNAKRKESLSPGCGSEKKARTDVLPGSVVEFQSGRAFPMCL